jgi:hypothetical protein
MNRFEISRSAEKAYTSLSQKDAQQIFLVNDTKTLTTLIEAEKKNGKDKGIEWNFDGNTLNFSPVRIITFLMKDSKR